MKLRNLQALLEGFEGFPKPNVELEQYPTPPRLAAEVIFNACNMYDDISGKVVADLGCGCGILSIGAYCMGASEVHGYDIDPLCIEAAERNCASLEFQENKIEFVQCDVTTLKDIHVDTVVMNPPFGTRRKGIDVEFLKVASEICTGAIYSFHKTSTRHHVMDIAAPKFGLKGDVMMEVDFDISKLYKFHKCKTKAVKVDVCRFVRV